MNAFSPSTADLYYPATFQDRGVALPFTTPMLAGARVRDRNGRGKELVLHNPSGGRGVYVIPLAGVRSQYRPTVHDVVLLQRIGALVTLSPTSVRTATWAVAREGFAGPDAQAAAATVADAEHAQVLMTEFQLVTTLIEQVEPSGGADSPGSGRPITPIAELGQRGRGVLTRLSRSLGRSGHELGQAIADLACLFAPVGLPPDLSQARIARLAGMIGRTETGIAGMFARGEGGAGATVGYAIIASAQIIIPCAQAALGAARALAADPVALLIRWFAARQDILATTNRAEWFLDGWEQICLLWQSSADPQTRLAALFEMAQIIPFLPREATRWSPRPLPASALAPNIHVASHNDDWRSGGRAMLLIDRNERMRAMGL